MLIDFLLSTPNAVVMCMMAAMHMHIECDLIAHSKDAVMQQLKKSVVLHLKVDDAQYVAPSKM